MSTTEQDLTRDIRPWLENHQEIADEYTIKRINASYGRFEELLDRCEGNFPRLRLDIGCHSGLDSFAMAAHFDHVLAIDPNPNAIAEAEAIARGADVTNLRFDCAKAEYYEPSEVFSFIFCNLMSHNVDSRCLLAVRMALALEERGWLHYAEEQEGYGPLELHRGIQRQDVAGVSERLRQILRGFTRTKGFRFFVSGSMEPLLKVLGIRCVTKQVSSWNGMPYQETMLCRQKGAPSPTQLNGSDPDYLKVPDEFQKMKNRFGEWITKRGSEGFDPRQREAIAEEAEGTSNRYGPFLNILLIADLALPSLDPDQSPRLDDLDWATLGEIDRRFIEQMRRHAGLEEGPIDD